MFGLFSASVNGSFDSESSNVGIRAQGVFSTDLIQTINSTVASALNVVGNEANKRFSDAESGFNTTSNSIGSAQAPWMMHRRISKVTRITHKTCSILLMTPNERLIIGMTSSNLLKVICRVQ